MDGFEIREKTDKSVMKRVKLIDTSDQDGYPLNYWDCPHCDEHHTKPNDTPRNVETKCPSCGDDVMVCTNWDSYTGIR